MERLAFDLDGTLYDTFSISFQAENIILQQYGYRKISEPELREAFQSKDFKKYYRRLGVAEEHLDTIINDFYPIFNSLGLPELIPAARNVLEKSEEVFGLKNLYFVTNATPENFQARFQRDGLEKYLPQVRNTLQGKAELLFALATPQEAKLTYVGDLVCDGEECLAARERGADNLYFYGLTHEYAFSPAEAMQDFVKQHQDFAQAVSSLEELSKNYLHSLCPNCTNRSNPLTLGTSQAP
ncbi:MAG: HAD hydrolase-like protein [Candidatus Woesearchaeota archaeon]